MKKDYVELLVDTSNKEFMFKLGFLFASGKQIKIVNTEEIDNKIIEEEKLGYAKSFNMMIKYWQDHGLNVNCSTIPYNDNNLFLICPVRNATKEEKTKLAEVIEKYENKGYSVHYPERDTDQNPVVNGENTGGFNICLQNAQSIAKAQTVAIFYNKTSTGSMFDLGVTCCLQRLHPNKNFILENQFEYDENNIIDRVIKELESNKLTERTL